MKIEIKAAGYQPVEIFLQPLEVQEDDAGAIVADMNVDEIAEDLEISLPTSRSGKKIPGPCHYSIFKQQKVASSDTERFVAIFQIVASLVPEKLPSLSARMIGPKRRTIGRSPAEIYSLSHLYHRAKEIAPGWFIDTNMDSDQKRSIVKRACEYLDLEFADDYVIS